MRSTHLQLTLVLLSIFSHLVASEPAPANAPAISPEFAAILRCGDSHKLRALLDRGAAPDARDAAGNTPLILASVYGDLACVQLLLDHGAQVNANNLAGATPLLRAATDYDKVKLLLAHGAEVNVHSALGNTPLILAARPAESHRTVELLLAHGAEARATNNFGANALMAAVAGGDAVTVKLLLERGVDPNSQSAMNDPGFIFGGGRSPLMWAAFRGNLEIMKLLVAAGADVNGEGFLGTPLIQAAWADHTAAARYLITQGAKVDHMPQYPDYTALHWAASTERDNDALVKLLLKHGANPNQPGGERVEAFLGFTETPLTLAQKRGRTSVTRALNDRGTTISPLEVADRPVPPPRQLPEVLDVATLRSAVSLAIAPLQESSLISKQSFVNHSSKQDCTSCHQQHLPLAAIGAAKQLQAKVDAAAEQQLVAMVGVGDLKSPEPDWEALFHPEAVHTKGYTLFGWGANRLPATEMTDAEVHHLATIQDAAGSWHNNLPRPPIQTGDVGATALAVYALQHYPLPARTTEFAKRVARARDWLGRVKPANIDERIYQLLGLAWAGESPAKLKSLTRGLLRQQRADGGWAQLPSLASDAYATGQAIYALRVGGALGMEHPAVARGCRFLLTTQLEDGTWFVARRAFPFQPTMKSGFPHGRDSWISASATSWAVLALSAAAERPPVTITSETSAIAPVN